ncbi:TPA: hypothetical protein ACX6SS_002479 [Photobacterium damselae]
MIARKLNFQLIDHPTFFGALGLLISTVVPLLLFPKEGAEWNNKTA